MSIFRGIGMKRNKDGYFRRSLTVTGPGGEKREITLRARSESELRDKVLRAQIDIERGELSFNTATKFARWAADWLETYKRGSVCPKNYKTYEQNIRKHINPVIGSMRLSDVKPVHCQRVLNKMQGKSFSLAGKVRMTMYQIFEAAVDNEMITRNPARSLTLPDVVEGTHRSLTDEERAYILQLVETHRAGLLVLVQLYCGLRPSEAVALNWSDIDFSAGTISVSHTLYNARRTKTDAGSRVVPAPPALMERLRSEKRKTKTTFVFHQLLDPLKPHTEYSLRSMWENFKRELDILMGAQVYRSQIIMSVVAPDLTMYCLRHTCATDYQTAGVPLNVAKVLLGHKDVRVTANIYTHYTAEQQAQTRSILADFWAGKKDETCQSPATFQKTAREP